MKLRMVEIDGELVALRQNVTRDGQRFRVQISRREGAGLSLYRKSFGDADYSGTREALAAAYAWMDAQQVRPSNTGLDLSRVPIRRLTLIRRLKSPAVNPAPAYYLEITPSKSKWRRRWMSIYVGGQSTISQVRIDAALIALRARWAAYRKCVLEHGQGEALDRDFSTVTWTKEESQALLVGTRLLLVDVLAWNGQGEGISYAPSKLVDPTRKHPYKDVPRSSSVNLSPIP